MSRNIVRVLTLGVGDSGLLRRGEIDDGVRSW